MSKEKDAMGRTEACVAHPVSTRHFSFPISSSQPIHPCFRNNLWQGEKSMPEHCIGHANIYLVSYPIAISPALRASKQSYAISILARF